MIVVDMGPDAVTMGAETSASPAHNTDRLRPKVELAVNRDTAKPTLPRSAATNDNATGIKAA